MPKEWVAPYSHNYCAGCGSPMKLKQWSPYRFDRITGRRLSNVYWTCSKRAYSTCDDVFLGDETVEGVKDA